MKKDSRFEDKIGAEYALFPLAAPHYGECQRLVGHIAASYGGERVLEIGCGTGLTTVEIAAAMPEAVIVALDAEEVMLDQAKRVLPSSLKLVCADALEYLQSLETGSVDTLVSAFCLHNMTPEYRADVFQEIGRVLAANGSIVYADKVAQDDVMEHWQALRDQIEAFSVFQTTDYPELQPEWTEHYLGLGDDGIRLTETELAQLFSLAGCGAPVFHARWMMDAVYSGGKV